MKPKLEKGECSLNLTLQVPRRYSPAPPGGENEMHAAVPGLSAQGQVDANKSQVYGWCPVDAGETTALCRNIASLAFLPVPQFIAMAFLV